MKTIIRNLQWTLFGRRAHIKARIDAMIMDFETEQAKYQKRRFPTPSSGNTAS